MAKALELSLRPYSGRVFVAATFADYNRTFLKVFKDPSGFVHHAHGYEEGRSASGEDKEGQWAYVVWAVDFPALAHELSHVILDLFDRCGIDPRECNGEPFCYLLSQLLRDCTGIYG